MKAMWKNKVLAESDETIVVEGNHYFPPDDIKREFFDASRLHTICPWKGEASYYDIVVDGEVNSDAAWFYPTPRTAAEPISNYVAFWRGVEVLP